MPIKIVPKNKKKSKSAKLAGKSFSETYKERMPSGTPSLSEAILAGGKMAWRKGKHALGYNKGGKVSKNWASCGANIITGRD